MAFTSSLAEVARHLGISRQAVSKLAKNRERTGFPTPNDEGQYDIDVVINWYINDFEPTGGPRRGIRA